MQPWVVLYEEKRRKWGNDENRFRWLNGKIIYYLNHLNENMTMIYFNTFLVEQTRDKYGASNCY